jgi:hypothetical protein
MGTSAAHGLARTLGLGAGLLSLQACSYALDFDATHAEATPTRRGFCSEHALPPAVFCDDFDELPVSTKWPAFEQKNGSLENDDGAALSAPSSLLSTARPVAAGANVRAVGGISFPRFDSTRVGLRVSFALRVEEFDATSGANNVVFDFLYGAPDDYNEIVLSLFSTETAVSLQVVEISEKDGEPSGQYAHHGPFVTKPGLGRWMKVDIDIDINDTVGQGNALRVNLDGHQEVDTALTLALKGGTPRLELGVGWVDTARPTQTWAIRYDDFLVEAVTLE